MVAFAVSSVGRAAGAVGIVPSWIALDIGSGIATGMMRSSELLYWLAMVAYYYYFERVLMIMMDRYGNGKEARS